MRHHSIRAAGAAAGLGAAVLLAVAFTAALESRSYNVWGAMLVVPLVVLVNGLLLAHVTSREDDPWIVRLMWLAFAAKLAATAARYGMVYLLYGGVSDATRYSNYAAWEYLRWRSGDVTLKALDVDGTEWLEMVTTAVFTVIGPSPLAGFFVFASFAFWGTYFFYRAFRMALPNGDRRRYALLVFLLPSLLFWPASIGKESWLLLFVGLTAYGAARFFAEDPRGLAFLALGAAGTAVVRPHVAVLTIGAVVAAQLLRPTTKSPISILTKVVGVVVLLAGIVVLAAQSAQFLELEETSWDALSAEIDERSRRATQGGSEFDAVPVRSLQEFPVAIVTVLFRPFPWEATNLQLLVQGIEGLVLLGLVIASWRRLRNLPAMLRRNPNIAFALFYVIAFAWAFSAVGNFGILARQRVLMLPAFLVLLALPAVVPKVTRRDDQQRATPTSGQRSVAAGVSDS
ncbi:hypothetical protein [Nostocoides sp. F2B08]|uniref:hypothetical protein n=1 Tax=Nostocoides sp. F2B08 TaxID=2653936 RepID=UPI00186AE3A2|nr:hypothetical protein [Tetrasphaera sp. F2B08]